MQFKNTQHSPADQDFAGSRPPPCVTRFKASAIRIYDITPAGRTQVDMRVVLVTLLSIHPSLYNFPTFFHPQKGKESRLKSSSVLHGSELGTN